MSILRRWRRSGVTAFFGRPRALGETSAAGRGHLGPFPVEVAVAAETPAIKSAELLPENIRYSSPDGSLRVLLCRALRDLVDRRCCVLACNRRAGGGEGLGLAERPCLGIRWLDDLLVGSLGRERVWFAARLQRFGLLRRLSKGWIIWVRGLRGAIHVSSTFRGKPRRETIRTRCVNLPAGLAMTRPVKRTRGRRLTISLRVVPNSGFCSYPIYSQIIGRSSLNRHSLHLCHGRALFYWISPCIAQPHPISPSAKPQLSATVPLFRSRGWTKRPAILNIKARGTMSVDIMDLRPRQMKRTEYLLCRANKSSAS